MKTADEIECELIKLKGATERLLMILEHRIDRNYEIAMQAVERAMKNYRAAVDDKGAPIGAG